MNWVDLLIVAMVLGLGFMGFRNGIIRWTVTLIGGIAGIFLAGRLYKPLSDILSIADNEGINRVAAFAVVLLSVMLLAWIVGNIIRTTLSIFLLGWVDRAAGAALGLFLGAVGATAIVSAMGAFPVESLRTGINGSALADPLVSLFGFVLALLPSEFDAVKDVLSTGKGLLNEGVEHGQDLLDRGQSLLGN